MALQPLKRTSSRMMDAHAVPVLRTLSHVPGGLYTGMDIDNETLYGAAGTMIPSTASEADMEIPGVHTQLSADSNVQIGYASGSEEEARRNRRNIKTTKWDKSDDALLLELCGEQEKVGWADGKIVKAFNQRCKVKRTINGLQCRYRLLKGRIKSLENWTEEEDAELQRLCSKYQGSRILWKKDNICAKLAEVAGTHRTIDSVRKRWAWLNTDNRETSNRIENVSLTVLFNRNIQTDGAERILTAPRQAAVSEDLRDKSRRVSGVKTVKTAPASEDATLPIPDEFRRIFNATLLVARQAYERKPIRKPVTQHSPQTLQYGSEVIKEHLQNVPQDFSKLGWLNTLVYAAAHATQSFEKIERQNSEAVLAEKAWYEQMQDKYRAVRKDIVDIRHELRRRAERRPPSQNELYKLINMRRKYGKVSSLMLNKVMAFKIKQEVLLKARMELRQFDKIRKSIRQRFAREPRMENLQYAKKATAEKCPSMREVMDFWAPIIAKENCTDVEGNRLIAEWAESHKEAQSSLQEVSAEYLRETAAMVIHRGKSWKACGPDGIPLYYWKHFKSAHNMLIEYVAQLIATGNLPFTWLARGRTVLVFKKGDRSNPSCYRPITCLNTVYKVYTGVIRSILHEHLYRWNIIPEQQRGLREGESSCLQASMIDQVVAYDAKYRRHPLSVVWLDFRKAFDSVSHCFLKWVLIQLGLPLCVTRFVLRSMRFWATRFVVSGQRAASKLVRIRNGIFQGDALSPELFVLCIAPISFVLNEHGPMVTTSVGRKTGFSLSLNHQCYIDDFKLYASSEGNAACLFQLVNRVAKTIGMQLNYDKCAAIHYTPGQHASTNGTDQNPFVRALAENQTYSYLGISQQLMPKVSSMNRMSEEVLQRSQQIFQSPLNWHLLMRAVRTLVIPKVKHVFLVGSRCWSRLEVMTHWAAELDGDMRKVMADCKLRYQKASVARLYLCPQHGGLGLPSVVSMAQESVVEAGVYVLLHPAMEKVKHFHKAIAKSGKRSIIGDCKKLLEEFGIKLQENSGGTVSFHKDDQEIEFREYKQALKWAILKMRETRDEKLLAAWRQQSLSARVSREINLHQEYSYLWLQKGALNGRAVRNIIAAQEGCLYTNQFKESGDADQTCRKCHGGIETPEHILTHCPAWLSSLYVERHNKIARCIYYKLCEQYNLPIIHYTCQIPAYVCRQMVSIYWDTVIPTQGKIHHNRPDIVVVDGRQKKVMIFEIAVSTFQGLAHQRQLKINRYTVNSGNLADDEPLPYTPGANLKEELRREYKCDVSFIPVIVGASGEYLNDTIADIKENWKMKEIEFQDLLERMARSSVLGSDRIIKNHLAVSTA